MSGSRFLPIRLPNHLGDACMALPAIDLIARQGFVPVLVGKPWATALFAGYRWPVVSVSGSLRQSAQALGQTLHNLRRQQGADVVAPAMLLTNSFSSALMFRLARARPVGYARDGRSFLLHRAVEVPAAWSGTMHTIDYYVHLASQYLTTIGAAPPVATSPQSIPQLRLSESAGQRAGLALTQSGIHGPFIVLCPVAQGLHHGQNKCWSEFGWLGQHLRQSGMTVVICPGPGETEAAKAAVPDAVCVGPLEVDAFAALLQRGLLVIANDSGPGHLAAAIGAPLLGIFGVTDPTKTCPRGSAVQICGRQGQWPSRQQVWSAVQSMVPLLAQEDGVPR
jgi:heptosyltransferase-2